MGAILLTVRDFRADIAAIINPTFIGLPFNFVPGISSHIDTLIPLIGVDRHGEQQPIIEAYGGAIVADIQAIKWLHGEPPSKFVNSLTMWRAFNSWQRENTVALWRYLKRGRN